jgi:hypothetical protein
MPDVPEQRGPRDRSRSSQQEHERRSQKEKKDRQTDPSQQDETGRNPGENES